LQQPVNRLPAVFKDGAGGKYIDRNCHACWAWHLTDWKRVDQRKNKRICASALQVAICT